MNMNEFHVQSNAMVVETLKATDVNFMVSPEEEKDVSG